MARAERLYPMLTHAHPDRLRIIDRQHVDEPTAVRTIVRACL